MRHPALIYFHDPECRPCGSASASFGKFVEADADSSRDRTNYYVLVKPGTADTALIAELDRRFPPPVQPYLIRGFNRSLGFVRDVPLFVATEGSARIRAAFVGLPDREVFDRLLR